MHMIRQMHKMAELTQESQVFNGFGSSLICRIDNDNDVQWGMIFTPRVECTWT